MTWGWMSAPVAVPVWLLMTYGAFWLFMATKVVTHLKAVKKK